MVFLQISKIREGARALTNFENDGFWAYICPSVPYLLSSVPYLFTPVQCLSSSVPYLSLPFRFAAVTGFLVVRR